MWSLVAKITNVSTIFDNKNRSTLIGDVQKDIG